MATNLYRMIDEYDRILAEKQAIVFKFEKMDRPIGMYQPQPETYDKISFLRQEISRLVRNHLQVVFAFDPQRQTWKELLRDRRQMRREINNRNNQINEIGGFYIRHKVSFEQGKDSDGPQESL